MRAIGIVGYKKTGKTTLAVALAQALKARGLTVAAAKFSHHHLDAPATDTARLSAVCDCVAGFGAGEAALFWSRPRTLTDLLPLLSADVLIVEGGKGLSWLPRVLLLRSAGEAEELGADLALATWNGPDPDSRHGAETLAAASGLRALRAVEELAELALARGFALPGLDCGACGLPGCRELAAAIVRGDAAPADCKAQGGAVRVAVGGAPVALNPFVAKVIAGAVDGMLGALKGYVPGSAVRIDIDAKDGGRGT